MGSLSIVEVKFEISEHMTYITGVTSTCEQTHHCLVYLVKTCWKPVQFTLRRDGSFSFALKPYPLSPCPGVTLVRYCIL